MTALTFILSSQAEGSPVGRVGDPIWGIVIPAVVFGISFALTWMLYRHFSRRPPA